MSESLSRAESESGRWVGFMGAQPVLMEMEYIKSNNLEALVIPNNVRRRQQNFFQNRILFHEGMCNGDFWDEGWDRYDDEHSSPSIERVRDQVPLHYVMQVRNLLRSGQLIE